MATEYQGWNEWAEKYKPVKNHFRKHDEYSFETYGEEVEYVKSMHPNFIWTWVDGEMCSLIVAGYSYVNRLSYYITENPWQDENDSVLLSVEKECECYDEEAMDNGDRQEYGDPNCEKCEGYGLITEYVG
jgi:hypothetical protein